MLETFFGRLWPCLMIIHFKDLRKAVRMLPKSAELSRGNPFLTALLPPASSARRARRAPVTDVSPTYSRDRRSPAKLPFTVARDPLRAAGPTQIGMKT